MDEKGLVKIDYNDPKMVATLKSTVAIGATDQEFAMFAEFCKSTGLNPFKKEIWFIKGKSYTNRNNERVEGRVQMMTGINGFHAIANSHPQYDGLESGLIDPNGDYKTQAYPKHDFIGAWCRVYRKDRRVPVEAVAMLKEYDKSEPDRDSVWKKMKRVMITKCAESVALRKALPQELNGLYTSEEMPPEYSEPLNVTPPPVAPTPPPPAKKPPENIEKGPFYYNFEGSTLTKEQIEFLDKKFCVFDSEIGAYMCPTKLGGKTEAFRISKPEAKPVIKVDPKVEALVDQMGPDDLDSPGWMATSGPHVDDDMPWAEPEDKKDELKRLQERVRKENAEKNGK